MLVKKSMLHASARLLVTTCALGGGSVKAEVTGLLSITSDYDYRGVSQTGNQAALQLGADYTREHVHCGVWGSNVRFDETHGVFDSRHSEIAYSADYLGGVPTRLNYDLGINYFTYPGWHPGIDYPEVFGTIQYGAVSASMHFAWNYSHENPPLDAYYLEANAVWPPRAPRLQDASPSGGELGPILEPLQRRGIR